MRFRNLIEESFLSRTGIMLGRLAATLVLLVLEITWHPAAMAHTQGMFHSGVGVYVAWTMMWFAFVFRGHMQEQAMRKVIGLTVIMDGIALALLTAATAEFSDPMLAWYVGETAVFSVVLQERRTWFAGAALAASYMIGHLAGAQMLHAAGIAYLTHPMQWLFMLVNAAVILLIAVSVTMVVGSQAERSTQIESQREEVLDLNQKLERSVAELRAVTEITELMHSTLEIETVGPILIDILEKVIDIPTAALYVIDKERQETVFSTTRRGGGGGLPRAYSGLELAGAMPVTVSDGALSCINLVNHDQMLVVFCADASAIDGLTRDDRIVLQAVASELIVAVENARLYRLTKRLAVTDELTDLYNYRYLQQRLDDELSRADRYGKRLSLLMLDLDDFKQVNDTYGHQVGDSVLAEVAHLLRITVREVDIVTRYGGEEFSIILPETDAPGAFIVAEKIREAVSLFRFTDAEGQSTIHLTVSIGLASYGVHAHDKESLLRAADDAVYRSKETGRDRVRAPRVRMRGLIAEPPSTGEVV